MDAVQPQTRKIKKRVRRAKNDPQNFVCGECNRSYKYYPGLYLHIRNKHDGIRPPRTTIIRPERKGSGVEAKAGRPKKSVKDLDRLDGAEASIEAFQNELISFCGDKLMLIRKIGPKISLESIVKQVFELSEKHIDKWLKDIGTESKDFLSEYQERDLKMQNLDFEEEFVRLDPSKGLKVLTWFMMWLGKLFVKVEFIPDLCWICSRVWKVMKETRIEAQDLDNKLVWKKVRRDCEDLRSNLNTFKDNPELLEEFIRKICQLIGRVFEEESQ